MAAGRLRWHAQFTIFWTVKTKPFSLFIPFWQDIIALHPQQGEKHHACCAFPRLLSFHISTDILLNMSLKVLLQVRLHRYASRLLVGNKYFPLVAVQPNGLKCLLQFLITLKKIMPQQEIFAHSFEKNPFVKLNPKFNIHMKRLLPYLIPEFLLTLVTTAYSVLKITLIFSSSLVLCFIQFKY